MSIIFKLFEVRTKEKKELLFQAYVKDNKTYRITEDLTGRFKKKFLKILTGRYKNSYIDNETGEEGYIIIDGEDPLENLEKYKSECSVLTQTDIILEDSNIALRFSLHFKGSDYNMDSGMSPASAKKASDFFYNVGTAMLIPLSTNNNEYEGAEEFTRYEAASIKMDMYSSNKFLVFRNTFNRLLLDIKRGELTSKDDIGYSYPIYKKLLTTFKELRKFRNLSELIIEIEEYEPISIINFDDVTSLGNSIYGNEVTGIFVIQSVNDYYRDPTYDGLIVDTRTFTELTTWKYYKNDALSSFLLEKKGENIKLSGWTTTEKGRHLGKIEFEREDFSISIEEKTKLENNGISVNDRVLTIS